MLYLLNKIKHCVESHMYGAGDENRTHNISLEG
jgi:hypothetical protein